MNWPRNLIHGNKTQRDGDPDTKKNFLDEISNNPASGGEGRACLHSQVLWGAGNSSGG